MMQSYRLGEIQGDLETWPFVEGGPSEYRVLRGDPRACGRLDLGAGDGVHRMGVWTCTAGAFECVERGDELQTILEGRLRIVREDGASFELGPGDSFFTRKGERLVWDVLEDVKKVFFTHDRDGVE